MLPLWWRRPGESLPLEPSKGRDKSNKAINEILRNFHTIRRRPWALTVALFSFSGGHTIFKFRFFNIVSSGQKYLLWKFPEQLYSAICEVMWVGVSRWVMGRKETDVTWGMAPAPPDTCPQPHPPRDRGHVTCHVSWSVAWHGLPSHF